MAGVGAHEPVGYYVPDETFLFFDGNGEAEPTGYGELHVDKAASSGVCGLVVGGP